MDLTRWVSLLWRSSAPHPQPPHDTTGRPRGYSHAVPVAAEGGPGSHSGLSFSSFSSHPSSAVMLLQLLRLEMFGRLEIDQVWQHQRSVLMQDFWSAIRDLYLRHQRRKRLLLVDSYQDHHQEPTNTRTPTNYGSHPGDTNYWRPSLMNQSVYSLINSPSQAAAALPPAACLTHGTDEQPGRRRRVLLRPWRRQPQSTCHPTTTRSGVLGVRCPQSGNESLSIWMIPTLVVGVLSPIHREAGGHHPSSRMNNDHHHARIRSRSRSRSLSPPHHHRRRHQRSSRSPPGDRGPPAVLRGITVGIRMVSAMPPGKEPEALPLSPAA